MELANFFPILLQIAIAIIMAAGILGISHLLGQKARTNPIKDTPYECGLIAEGERHPRFSVKFYVVAMLFILFDIEIVFLVPWTVIYREFLQHSIPIFLPMLFFLGVLVIGLLYEIKKGALEWEK